MYEGKLNNIYLMTLASVIFVSLIFNLFIRNELDFSYLMLDLNDMGNLTIHNRKDVIQYILLKRIKQFVVLIILIKAFGIEKVFNVMTIIGGGIIGLMVSSQVYYLGLMGLVILMLYLLPHYILYYMGLYYGYKEKILYVGMDDNLRRFAMFCFIFLIGIILECSFMTFFLKNFYQYMVT